MTYQPKSKMMDFETLVLGIFLRSSQICTYFYKVLSVPGKNSIPNRDPFWNWFYYPYLTAMGLTSREIHVY